jgi:hypothetical protein
MQVVENNSLFTQVSGEESAIVSGGVSTYVPHYNFIGLATFFVLVLILWGLDQGLFYPSVNNSQIENMSTLS